MTLIKSAEFRVDKHNHISGHNYDYQYGRELASSVSKIEHFVMSLHKGNDNHKSE